MDVKAWAPLLVDGGVIARHDTNWSWPGPQIVAFHRLYLSLRYRRVGTVGSITLAERGAPSPLDIVWRLRVFGRKFFGTISEMRVLLPRVRQFAARARARARRT